MVYRLVQPTPTCGSTAWGAAQTHRLLDEEERAAAERRRLLATGWRPPALAEDIDVVREGMSRTDGDAHYVDLLQRQIDDDRALEEI